VSYYLANVLTKLIYCKPTRVATPPPPLCLPPKDWVSVADSSRVARFLLVRDTKTGKKCPQSAQNVPNGHKIYLKIFQMAIKYINIFQSSALKNLPKLGFLV
jgi:hypothetical protein